MQVAHIQPLNFKDTANAFAWQSDDKLRNSYQMFRLINNRFLVDLGAKMTQWAIDSGLPFVETAVKYTIYNQICGGETIKECQPIVDLLDEYGVTTILDYGVEARQHEIEFEESAQYLVHKVIRKAADDPKINIISSKITSLIRFELLEKVSSGIELSDEEANEYERGKRRVKFICKNAFDNKIAIYFDAEESWIQNAIDDVVTEMQAFYNRLEPIVFNTIQFYRVNRLPFLKESYKKAKEAGYLYAVKIVRGAYMEKERNRAEEMGYESPIQLDKKSCDKDYNEALKFCVKHIDDIAFCNATHNEESCLLLANLMIEAKQPKNHPHVYTGQLFGMSDHISFNMAKAGFNVSKYLPFGPVKDVIPYLIRRANENTAVGDQMGRELSLLKEEIDRRGI